MDTEERKPGRKDAKIERLGPLPYKAYRYECSLYSNGNEETGFSTYQRINLLEYSVYRETPKGMWIGFFPDHLRFVLLHGRKRFAHLTKSEALESFIARKKHQVVILESQLRFAREALMLAEKGMIPK